MYAHFTNTIMSEERLLFRSLLVKVGSDLTLLGSEFQILDAK